MTVEPHVKLFYSAIVNKKINLVEEALDKHPELVNDTWEGRVPLVQSIQNGIDKISMILINRGADVNAVNKFGYSPILMSLAKNKTKITDALIEKGADVTVFDTKLEMSVLMWTAQGKDQSKFIKKILDTNMSVNVNHQSVKGETALMMSTRFTDEKSMKMLLDAGADPYIKNKKGGTALDERGGTILKGMLSRTKIGKFKDFLDL